MSPEYSIGTATSKIFKEKRTMLARLEDKLGFSVVREDINATTLEALSALSDVHRRAKEKIRKNLEFIRELKIDKNNAKGSIYATILQWVGLVIFILAIPTFFILARDEIYIAGRRIYVYEANPEALSAVTTLVTLGILIIVVSAIVEYYTKFLETERIDKRIRTIETENEAFSNKICEEIDFLLTKLAEQIRLKKDALRKENLKKRIQTYVMAYKEVEMERIRVKFKININEVKVLLRELINENKLKGTLKKEGKSFVAER